MAANAFIGLPWAKPALFLPRLAIGDKTACKSLAR
jgi:hypothetical protein